MCCVNCPNMTKFIKIWSAQDKAQLCIVFFISFPVNHLPECGQLRPHAQKDVLSYIFKSSWHALNQLFQSCHDRFQSHIFPEFCDELVHSNIEQGHILHLWAASCQHNIAPVELQDSNSGNWEIKYFTKPLRSPPSVIREVEKATEIRRRKVLRYTERGVPDHTDGPPVEWMNHLCREHESEEIKDCFVCGRNVANFLCKELRLVKSTACK